jgi:hypothetical protein
MIEKHTGELLFHCWQHDDRQRACEQFDSIVRRGLLLTINSNKLDSFRFIGDSGLESMDVMQKARVCFTEIPLHLLGTHSYGQFAVGFRRKTIIDWGGLPAWYLPNHPGNETLKELAAEIIRGLHASAIANENLQVLARDIPPMLKQQIPEQYLSRDFEISLNFTHGKPLSGEALQQWLERNKQVMYQIISYVKEMSPTETEDYRYLNEREWRIVAGAGFRGSEVCRVLTDTEKSEFGVVRPAWLEPVRSTDINVQVRYPSARIIDHFRFFNGVSGKTVSQMIDVVLVPDRRAKRDVHNYIKANPSAFRVGGPRVQLYPSTAVRLAWLSLSSIWQSSYPSPLP